MNLIKHANFLLVSIIPSILSFAIRLLLIALIIPDLGNLENVIHLFEIIKIEILLLYLIMNIMYLECHHIDTFAVLPIISSFY